MKKSDFNFSLPKELIAQVPLEKRDASRLLTLDRKTGEVQNRTFSDLLELLRPGDCLVMNDSRVIPARLMGERVPSGAVIETLLLHDRGDNVWECLTKPGKKTPAGTKLSYGGGLLNGEVIDALPDGNKLIRFTYEGVFLEVLSQLGEMPLPPYIKEKLNDPERYQTVYSKAPGSAAAPTAGLHFTKEMLLNLEQKGVKLSCVTLHVGLGTFRPVKEDEIADHIMHSEFYIIDEKTAQTINETRKKGGRIVSVGTTACRTLETAADENGVIHSSSGWTDIFIYPGYAFRVVDALITNFHLPESTLIMLVSAFAGREHVLHAYEKAVEERYRFFSFGDAMYLY
ncbi:MAG: tRNA preQ1(34) S-adenosylmethionine ribosyltransferase-isomerase QueA [Clostridiales bacterium]|nr:tRNA preQ1(34) S-adenosylmethionine ribosyltransferase-isomerase QueA [Clostridiales bacterium]